MSCLHRYSNLPPKNGNPPQELLDDLCSRFVLNVPKEDQQSFERILFLVEYAHWFYEDNSVEKNPSLKSFNLKEFTSLLFSSCDVLKPYVPHIDDIFKDFTSYKFRVPVTGAIILDESYERVLEETGFDVSMLLNKEEYIESVFGQQRVRLYIIAGVKDDIPFAPLTKKEISEISWQPLDELLPASNDVISHGVCGVKLYMVAPFLGSLRSWILKHHHPQPATTTKSYAHSRGMTVWKAKHGSAWSIMAVPSAPAAQTQPQLQPPPPSVVTSVSNGLTWDDMYPGRSFRNFKIDGSLVLQAMDAAFWSH